MISGLEMLTGYTLEDGLILHNQNGISYQTYKVVKQSISGAKQRINSFDLVTCFLVPTLRDMTFEPLTRMTGDAIKRLQKEEPTHEILSRIQFLHAAKAMIDKFCKEQNVLQKTKKCFKDLFERTHPNEQYLFGSFADNLYEKLVDMDFMKKFINENANKGDCYSGCMTVETACQFWSDPKAISGRCDNHEIEILCTNIRFLMSSKNSSEVERKYCIQKRNCHPNRHRLKPKHWHQESFLREVRRQKQVFIDLKPKNQLKKRDKKIRKV